MPKILCTGVGLPPLGYSTARSLGICRACKGAHPVYARNGEILMASHGDTRPSVPELGPTYCLGSYVESDGPCPVCGQRFGLIGNDPKILRKHRTSVPEYISSGEPVRPRPIRIPKAAKDFGSKTYRLPSCPGAGLPPVTVTAGVGACLACGKRVRVVETNRILMPTH